MEQEDDDIETVHSMLEKIRVEYTRVEGCRFALLHLYCLQASYGHLRGPDTPQSTTRLRRPLPRRSAASADSVLGGCMQRSLKSSFTCTCRRADHLGYQP